MRFLYFLIAALSPCLLSAEEIGGTLFDRTGGVISGARVMLMDKDYVKLAETKSGEQGEFAFGGLKPALYLVQAKKPRFSLVQQHIYLEAGQSGRVHLVTGPGRAEDVFGINSELPPGVEPASPTPLVFRKGGELGDYKLVKRVMPAFPESAKKRGAHGMVVVNGTIGTDGAVTDVMTLESPDAELEKVCVEAFRQWRYEPVKLNGAAADATATAIFRFEYRR